MDEKLILDGQKVANDVKEGLKPRIAVLKEDGIIPSFGDHISWG